MTKDVPEQLTPALSRREVLATAGVVAAAGLVLAAPAQASVDRPAGILRPRRPSAVPPFDSIRDYLAAMHDWGLLTRFKDVDQDA